MDILIPTVIGAIVGGLIGFAYDKYNQALDMQAECLAKEMKLRADHAYDSYVGDNHPAHDKQ